MAFGEIRNLLFQNAASGKIYAVTFTKDTTGAVNGRATLQGVNRIGVFGSVPKTVVSFVVLTSQVSALFGVGKWHDTALADGAYFHATDRAGVGVKLSALLA